MLFRPALLGIVLAGVLTVSPGPADPATKSTAVDRGLPAYGLYGVRWDPCHPITYRIVGRSPYAAGTRNLRRAFRTVAAATGMTFVYVGRRAADVTVRWSSPATTPDLRGPVAARTTTDIDQHDGVWENTAGLIRLDRTVGLRTGFAPTGPITWGQVYLHELGHLVGLDHVLEPSQVMYPVVLPTNHRYGSGDLRRLRMVGRAAGCVRNSQR
ncbi:matrixin family metalloprotease [Marmoricola sp. RAF53]|uniref:matrixin family metalloprotease n=1 Tax=Marmoricola sp. RAF53 TaxID=3233059 RepID=UPI003F9D7224